MVLFRHFFLHALRDVLFTAFALLTVLAVIEFFDTARIVLKDEGSFTQALTLYLLWLPRQLSLALPLAVLLGLVTGYGGLVRAREVLAARAGGVGTARLVAPGVVVALLLAGGAAVLAEYGVPPADKEADRLRVEVFKGFTWEWTRFNTAGWFRAEKVMARVQHCLDNGHQLVGVLLFEHDDDFRMRRRVEAKELRFREGQWVGKRVLEVNYRPDGTIQRASAKVKKLDLAVRPADFKVLRGRPHQLSAAELDETIGLRRLQGRETRPFEQERHRRFSGPALILVAALLGLAVALRVGPGGSLVAAMARAVGLAFVVWSAVALFGSLGQSETVGVLTAVWVPVALSLSLGVLLLARVRT